MKYFQNIPKEWKQSQQTMTCEHCRQTVTKAKDYFTVKAHWKIKDDADSFSFCSLACLGAWTKEESLVEVEG